MSTAWKNDGAGPRQVKDLNKAISALRREGQTRDEVTGVIGGEEHTWSYMSLMGPVRPEIAALDEEIRAKYGHQITRETVRQIIADYEATIPEARKSRPTDDKRRTPGEDAELQASIAARDAEDKARQDAQTALLDQVMAKAPRGAKALIVAEYRVDASDPMTDYFASHTARTVAIGWRYSAREDFKALHAAAAQFSETADLEFSEHRENWSLGGGNYLASGSASSHSGTGWVIKSATFPCAYVHLTEDVVSEPAVAPASGDSGSSEVTVSPSSRGKPGVVEIQFADKPAPDVREALKDRNGAAFRWAKTTGCWYGHRAAYEAARAAGAPLPELPPETVSQEG